jgi:hypothetical protein
MCEQKGKHFQNIEIMIKFTYFAFCIHFPYMYETSMALVAMSTHFSHNDNMHCAAWHLNPSQHLVVMSEYF